MPISTSGVITAAQGLTTSDGQRSGATRASDFAIVGDVNHGTQLNFALTNVSAGSAVTLEAPAASGTIGVSGVSQNLQYATPTTGQTVALSSTTTNLIIEPAGNLNALTITLPAASDGKKITASCTKAVTTLTVTANGSDTIANAATAFPAGGVFTLVARSTVWYNG